MEKLFPFQIKILIRRAHRNEKIACMQLKRLKFFSTFFAFDANEEKYFIDFIDFTDMVATTSIEQRFKK
jgi:hypothetical protein